MVISKGNQKLGVIPSFSLPAMETCPGKTEFCDRYCYATKGRFAWKKTKEELRMNLMAAQCKDFAGKIAAAIRQAEPQAFRLHVSGDFYDYAYVGKWIQIAQLCPGVMFFGSTRSWRIPALNGRLQELAALPNVCLRASTDFTHVDQPDEGWSVLSIEGRGEKCPHDYGLVDHCMNCGKCWRNKKLDVKLKPRWGSKLTNWSPSMI